MKKALVLGFLVVLLIGCAPTRRCADTLQASASWQRIKLFEGDNYTSLHTAYKVSDGYVVVGVDNHNGLLIKTDEDGIMQWVQRFSYTAHDELYSARETRDGGYVLVGSASGDGQNDGILIKTSRDGREQWHQIFGVKCNRLHGIDETDDGFVLAGSTSNNEFGYVIRTNSSGERVADAVFGSPKSLNKFNSIRKTENGFLLTGCTGAETWNERHGWVVELDSALKKRREMTYSAQGHLFLSDALPTQDGGYMLVGMIEANGCKAHLMNVTSSLLKEWDVTFQGGINELYPSLFEETRGNYTILSGNGCVNNSWISKISRVGAAKHCQPSPENTVQ